MTCESCNQHVEHEVSTLPGYITALADFKTGTVKVQYDNYKNSEKEIAEAIHKAGYRIVNNN